MSESRTIGDLADSGVAIIEAHVDRLATAESLNAADIGLLKTLLEMAAEANTDTTGLEAMSDQDLLDHANTLIESFKEHMT